MVQSRCWATKLTGERDRTTQSTQQSLQLGDPLVTRTASASTHGMRPLVALQGLRRYCRTDSIFIAALRSASSKLGPFCSSNSLETS